MDAVCDAQALVLGPAVTRFEANLAAYCGAKHAVGVTSGTDALLVSLMALGVGPGDEVICPAFTFFATAGCVARLGARPVFVDVEPGSFNVDPAAVKRAVTGRTKAVIPVDLFGQVAKLERVAAAAPGVPIIEDAAQAIGAKRFGKPACSTTTVGCLSFYPTKNLGAFGDAGAVCTNDDALADRLRLLREHGMRPRYYYKEIGGMFRIAALQAAVLDVKLKYLDGWHAARRRNARLYDELLAGSAVVTPAIDDGNQSVYNQYCVRIPGDRDAARQAAGRRAASAARSTTRCRCTCRPASPTWATGPGTSRESERACREVLALPIYAELPEEQLRYVAAEVLAALG